MSQSAFAAMVSDIKRNGLPDLATDHASGMRKLVAGARNAVVGSDSQYGDMIYRTRLDAMPGKPRVVLEHLNVQAYIQYAYGLGGSFANLVDSVHRARPSTLDVPWGVIIYADEVEPGQELAARHERKIYAVYVTIREFGPPDDFKRRGLDHGRDATIPRATHRSWWAGDSDWNMYRVYVPW